MANTYMSGFCSIGSHEGTRPKSPTGTPLKVCEMWELCTCDCHVTITKMCEMTGQPRIPMPNPEYVHPERTYWMPSDDPTYAMPTAAPEISEGAVAVAERVVQTTATGRTQRGGLEFWVQRECLAWMVDRDPEYGITVKILSEEIGRIEGIKPPSQGAIGAVFDRWVKYGYAVIERVPVRFVGLTPDGETNGLEWCKARFKNEQVKASA
jgi:hypothetical protein